MLSPPVEAPNVLEPNVLAPDDVSAPDASAPDLSRPTITVVIPTYRRPELLCRCVAAVLAQRMSRSGNFEIIVVDDGHDEATRETIAELSRGASGSGSPALGLTALKSTALFYLRPEQGRGPAVARNCGWRHARGALIAFTDDDTVPQPGWLENGAREMARHAEWSALCGRVEVPLDGAARQRPTDHELMTRGLETAEFVTANAFVRRDALLRIGGFDEAFKRAWREDSDLQFRLMQEVGPVGRCSDAVVLHPVRREPWGLCLRQQRNAYFDALLYKKHPRLYRERIDPTPPWNYYAIVGLCAASLGWLASSRTAPAAIAVVGAAALVARVAWRRVRPTRRTPAHVTEMIVTSVMIPFLSVFWRLCGALRFRVLFL